MPELVLRKLSRRRRGIRRCGECCELCIAYLHRADPMCIYVSVPHSEFAPAPSASEVIPAPLAVPETASAVPSESATGTDSNKEAAAP